MKKIDTNDDLHYKIVEMKYSNKELYDKIYLIMHLIQIAQLSLSPDDLEQVFGDSKYLNEYNADESINDALEVERLAEVYENDEDFQTDPLVNKCMENRLLIAMDIVGVSFNAKSVLH